MQSIRHTNMFPSLTSTDLQVLGYKLGAELSSSKGTFGSS